ncbi:hypothetical protein AYL99_11037 [Fonsecaea erecta]|uniref:Uncharacterized protein n=1 Tax=Fonsecaea erecta TaxID=1367422 RepID=A0A178Z4C2_9EURO|nr:hypothetical protein AYL99_11037 [Fonsecaea erecta]OAP54589.1 hypothetical protein AYL99_11037 [Fonsecaea erecta]
MDQAAPVTDQDVPGSHQAASSTHRPETDNPQAATGVQIEPHQQQQQMRLSQILEEAVKSTELPRKPVGLLAAAAAAGSSIPPVASRPLQPPRMPTFPSASPIPPRVPKVSTSPSSVPISVLLASLDTTTPPGFSMTEDQPTTRARTDTVIGHGANKKSNDSTSPHDVKNRNKNASTTSANDKGKAVEIIDVDGFAQAHELFEAETEKIASEKLAGKMKEIESKNDHAARLQRISVEQQQQQQLLEELRADLIQSAQDNNDLRHEVAALEQKIAHMEQERQDWARREAELIGEVEYWTIQAHAQAQAAAAVAAATVLEPAPTDELYDPAGNFNPDWDMLLDGQGQGQQRHSRDLTQAQPLPHAHAQALAPAQASAQVPAKDLGFRGFGVNANFAA